MLRLMLALMFALPATAQARIPSHCVALADAGTPVHRASFADPVAADTVRIRYIDHASFALRTPQGRVLVTDYTGFLGVDDTVPDVVTMNNAHGTHWTATPDPRIPHILPGWDGRHTLDLGEVLVLNVATDVMNRGFVRKGGNSIFIFEVAGLCIGHLGHLHHIPDNAQFAEIGRLDVVMVPVDGGYTLDLASMMLVVRRLRSSVVVPMHWFSGASLQMFLAEMSDQFEVVQPEMNQIDLSLSRLPTRPTIMVLHPEYLP
jgi:L-ascorbate metabolism protein UlaG (beta-lactamase superfamily)